jgi:putative glutamine amidotransferase
LTVKSASEGYPLKIILVSQRLVGNAGYPEIREALDVEWGRFLSVCGFLPVPVAAHVPVAIYFSSLKPAGVLLTGGNDLGILAPQDALSLERDRVERELIQFAIQTQIPILGVCRGMQMLAHYFGGTLEKKSGHVTPSHEVSIQSESLIRKVYGKTKLDVNSFHNYCVVSVAGGLSEAARHRMDRSC